MLEKSRLLGLRTIWSGHDDLHSAPPPFACREARYLAQYGFKISLSGRIYLSLLLTRASIRVVSQRRVDDLEIAEENLRRLLMEASGGMSAAAAGPELVRS
jgi:hypothetical protein